MVGFGPSSRVGDYGGRAERAGRADTRRGNESTFQADQESCKKCRESGWRVLRDRRLVVPLSSASAQTRLEAPNVPAIAAGWSIDTTPNRAGSPDTELFGVSCPDAAYCVSVGYSEHDGDLVPLAEVWNATTWKKMIVPSPTDSPITYLYGVDCVASNDCVAVGQYDYQASGVQDTLVEVWNGADWSIQASPDAAKAVGSYLYGVSCTAADACTAVGYSITPNQQILPLAEAWDGSSWTLQTTPRPAYSATKYSQTTYLYSVSCTGPDACVAVGFYEAKTGYNQPVSEVWNGTAWTLEYPLIPSGVNYGNHLYGVSCTGADSCTAVGYTDGGGTLVETWNATAWSIQASANPVDAAVGSQLWGVSCTAADSCTAVGFSQVGDGYPPLAEVWDGLSWTVQTTPYPTGKSYGTFLYGVSCTGAGNSSCAAVGNHYTNQSPTYTRAYQYSA